jgi:23S rRNA pseudouridine1911/1915/1917 synthase
VTPCARLAVPHDPNTVQLVVMPAEQGLRLDQFLATATNLSRRAARRLIDDGAVRRNGQPARVQSRTVTAGDVIDVSRPGEGITSSPRPTVATPAILFEDGWVLVADKPSGILSQPSESLDSSELAFDQIMLLGIAARDCHRPYLRLVHRLDRHTSGVVLFGRTPKAMRPLTEAWAAGAVDRRYFAVVEGHPEFEIRDVDQPIERDRRHEWRFSGGSGGLPARTTIRVVDRLPGNLGFVECQLLTGRTHQVRVHLAAIGLPVAGDRLYGGRRSTAARPLLHATMLTFPHPHGGAPTTVVCPPPPDFDRFLTDPVTARIDELTVNAGDRG